MKRANADGNLIDRRNMTQETLDRKLICRTRELSKAVGISRSTLWVWTKRPDFPKPCRLGPRVIGWRIDEVQYWLEQLSSAKQTGLKNQKITSATQEH